MRLFSKFFQTIREPNDGIKHRALKAGLWVGLSSTIVNLLSLFRSIILARLLSPEIFGIWAICTTLVRALKVFSETGFNTALIQRKDNIVTARDTAFTLLILRGVLLMAVAIATAPLFSTFYNQPVLFPLVCVLSVSFFITGFHNVSTVLYEKELRYRRLVYLEQGAQVLTFIFVVVSAYIFRSVWVLVAAHLAMALFTVGLSYLVIPERPRIAIDRKVALELFHYGKYVSGAAIVIFITFETDNLVIGKVLGMESLGFYTVAFMLANLPATHLAKVISGVMLPAYSKLQDNPAALRAAYLRVLEFVSLLAVPTAIVLGVLAPQIIGVIYGERWLPAVDALRVLSLFGCLRAITALSGYLYNAIGKPHTTFYINLAKLAVIAVLIYPLTMRYGIMGAALSVTIPSILTFLADYYLLRKTIGLDTVLAVKPLLRSVIFSLVLAVVLYELPLVIGASGITSLITTLGVGALVYLLLAWNSLTRFYAWVTEKRA